VLREGGIVRSLPVNHRPRERGTSKYGVLDRLAVGIADLAGVMWLRRRRSLAELLAEETQREPAPAHPATAPADPVL
jgi:dolichol-phosphate mannosyltransferase